MGYSRLEYTYTGGAQVFPVPFALGYINQSDVTCFVQGEEDALGEPLLREFTWLDDANITVTNVLPNPCTLVIDRTVSKEQLVLDVTGTAAFTRATLVKGFKQLMMGFHELLDGRVDEFNDIIEIRQLFADAEAQLASAQSTITNADTASAAAVAAQADADAAAAAAAAARDQILNLTTSASGLAAGAQPTSSYNPGTGVLALGIPTGATGAKGDVGPAGPTANVGIINPLDYGATGDGVTNDDAALKAARADAIANGWGILLPAGSYNDGTGVFTHVGPRLWLPADSNGDASFAYWRKVEQSMHVTGYRGPTEGRDVVLIKFDLESDGAEHASLMRLQHSSHEAGEGGNTVVYARNDNGPRAGWHPVYHAESHRVGGSVFGLNVETKNYYTDNTNTAQDDNGEQVGVNLKMSTGTRKAHTKTADTSMGGGSLTPFATPKAINIIGTVGETYDVIGGAKDGTVVGDEGGWLYGIYIKANAMRSTSIGFYHEGGGRYGIELAGRYTDSALQLRGENSPRGIDLAGVYTDASIRMREGQKFRFDNAGKNYMQGGADRVYFGSDQFGHQVEIVTGTGPGIFVNGQRVLSGRQAAIPILGDATGGIGGSTLQAVAEQQANNNFTKLNGKINEILAHLRTIGQIAT